MALPSRLFFTGQVMGTLIFLSTWQCLALSKPGSQAGQDLLVRKTMCGATMLSRKKLALCSIIIVAMCVKMERNKVKKKMSSYVRHRHITKQSLMKLPDHQHGHFTCLPTGKSNKPINKKTARMGLQALHDQVDGA